VLFTIWRGPPSPLAVAEMNQIARELVVKDSLRASYFSIVEPTSPPPNDKARAELARFSREIVPDMAAAIIVGEGGGFRASLVRAVGVTLTVLMPHRVPFKFLGNVEEAITLIAPHLSPGAGGAEGLRRALADIRAQFPMDAGSEFPPYASSAPPQDSTATSRPEPHLSSRPRSDR
jgi:hypothetical protein